MLTKFYTMLNELERNPETLNKISLLKEFYDPEIGKLMNYALSDYITFGVKNIPEPIYSGRTIKDEDEAYTVVCDLLDLLASRGLTGGRAQVEIARVLGSLTPKDGIVLKRIISKDLRCGVSNKIANKAVKNMVPTFEIQLAPSELAIPEDLLYPQWAEVKLDGYRAVAIKNGGVTLHSRKGLLFENFEEIRVHLMRNMCDQHVLDMEIMSPRGFGVLKKRAGADQGKNTDIPIYAVAFDAMPLRMWNDRKCTLSYEGRRDLLMDLLEDLDPMLVKPSVQTKVHNASSVVELYDKARLDGHEGLILKKPGSHYQFSRTGIWRKMKPFASVTLKVVGFDKGEAGKKYEDTLGALLLEGTYDNKRIETKCGGGFSDDMRYEIWNNRGNYLDRMAEIKFMELTQAEGKADIWSFRHPSFIRWRDDK